MERLLFNTDYVQFELNRVNTALGRVRHTNSVLADETIRSAIADKTLPRLVRRRQYLQYAMDLLQTDLSDLEASVTSEQLVELKKDHNSELERVLQVAISPRRQLELIKRSPYLTQEQEVAIALTRRDWGNLYAEDQEKRARIERAASLGIAKLVSSIEAGDDAVYKMLEYYEGTGIETVLVELYEKNHQAEVSTKDQGGIDVRQEQEKMQAEPEVESTTPRSKTGGKERKSDEEKLGELREFISSRVPLYWRLKDKPERLLVIKHLTGANGEIIRGDLSKELVNKGLISPEKCQGNYHEVFGLYDTVAMVAYVKHKRYFNIAQLKEILPSLINQEIEAVEKGLEDGEIILEDTGPNGLGLKKKVYVEKLELSPNHVRHYHLSEFAEIVPDATDMQVEVEVSDQIASQEPTLPSELLTATNYEEVEARRRQFLTQEQEDALSMGDNIKDLPNCRDLTILRDQALGSIRKAISEGREYELLDAYKNTTIEDLICDEHDEMEYLAQRELTINDDPEFLDILVDEELHKITQKNPDLIEETSDCIQTLMEMLFHQKVDFVSTESIKNRAGITEEDIRESKVRHHINNAKFISIAEVILLLILKRPRRLSIQFPTRWSEDKHRHVDVLKMLIVEEVKRYYKEQEEK